MEWFRANLKVVARLAIFALTVQFALSFGHVHLGQPYAVAFASTGTQASGSTPAQHPVGDADDYCAICATIHLSATSFVPQAPHLLLPFLSRPVEHFGSVPAISFSPRRAPFQSRAPPLA